MECTFRKRKKGKKILIFLACVMIFAVFSVIYLNQKLDPLVCAAATPQIKAEMTRVINEAISEAMTGYEEKLVSIRYGTDGKILSIETDSTKINLLRALVTEKINEKIKAYGEYGVTISLSNILDDEIILGRFPSIAYRLMPMKWKPRRLSTAVSAESEESSAAASVADSLPVAEKSPPDVTLSAAAGVPSGLAGSSGCRVALSCSYIRIGRV